MEPVGRVSAAAEQERPADKDSGCGAAEEIDGAAVGGLHLRWGRARAVEALGTTLGV
jgi:hypothetical protein